MGKRLHVQKKHVIEYADSEFFNWKHEDFYHTMQELGCCISDSGGDDFYGDSIEITVDTFQRAIKIVQSLIESYADSVIVGPKDGLKAHEMETADFAGYVAQLYNLLDENGEYKVEDVQNCLPALLDNMQYMYDKADKNDGWIHLDWF